MQEKKCWWNILKDCYPAAIAGHNPQTTSLVRRPAKDDDGTSLARVSLGFGTLCEIDSNSNSDSLAVLD
jgi:hypothetical protein